MRGAPLILPRGAGSQEDKLTPWDADFVVTVEQTSGIPEMGLERPTDPFSSCISF